MTIEKISTTALFASYDASEKSMTKLIAMLTETEINTVPFKDSWTAGELMNHVTKAIKGITNAMDIEGKPAQRNYDAGLEKLKETFLNFDTKMKSPEFILPAKKHYGKEEVIDDLENAFMVLKQKASEKNLGEAVMHPIFKEITRYEMLYFIEVHTKRHLHQLEKIYAALKKR